MHQTIASSAQPARPNILYLYVDDMGWGAIGPNAQFERKAKGLPYLVTPTLDRLAREGVNFSRSYGCTVCSPARSSQQTGFHQGHTFADQNDPDNAKKAIRTDDLTIGDMLSKAGYVTGYWGKWGYGGSQDKANPEILNVQTLPTQHGYQHVLAELHHVRAHTFFQPTLWKAPAVPGTRGGIVLVPNSMKRYQGDKRYPEEPALQNDPDYPQTSYCDDLYTFSALDFVRVQAQNYNTTGQPFFGLLAVQVPHAPFAEISQLPKWDRAYRNLPFWSSLSDQAKQWAAMVNRIDGHFGNILNALEDPDGNGDRSDSVLEKTLIIFTSDNGGPQHPARDEFDANGGLRLQKGTIEEGGLRIPTLVRLPADFAANSRLKAGTSTDILMDVTDMLPTFCELAGVLPPLGIDGVSLAPTLFGRGDQRTREFLIHEAGNGQSIIRGDYKLIRRKNGLELYNLKEDHAEAHDIAGKLPKLVKELETLLLGERVTEPRGFANTYHHWIGANGALAGDPANWSDYVYANEGITYTTDAGAPQLAWTAHMINTTEEKNYAVANQNLEFLALEIGGESAKQSLVLDPYINLTGRNEIRISNQGSLTLNQGSISTLRWVEISLGGDLKGTGTVEGCVYNQGHLSGQAGLKIVSDYYESPEAVLELSLDRQASLPLKIDGKAELAGELVLVADSRFKPEKGKAFALLHASKIAGAFRNKKDLVTDQEGRQFKIHYRENAVELTLL